MCLANGNTLTCGRTVRELNPHGETVWEFTSADVPDDKFNSMQLAMRLPNGDTLIESVERQRGSEHRAGAGAGNFTGQKSVWALRSWVNPNLGPATTIQLLDEPAAPENTHFGSIK